MKSVFTIELVREEQCFTDILVHRSGHGRMLFSGDGMWQWFGNGDGLDHLRSHRTKICWAQWLHDGLAGMHATILHAEGGPFAIHSKHPDYDFMCKLWDFGLMDEHDVLKLSDDELRVVPC